MHKQIKSEIADKDAPVTYISLVKASRKKLGLVLSMYSNEYAKKIDQSKANTILTVDLHARLRLQKISSWGQEQKSLVKT